MVFQEGKRDVVEGKDKPVVFHIAHRGLEQSLHEVVTDEEFKKREPNDFEPNLNWDTVKVANEAAKQKWVDLENEWLNLAWESNQSPDEQVENGKRMKEIEAEKKALEQ